MLQQLASGIELIDGFRFRPMQVEVHPAAPPPLKIVPRGSTLYKRTAVTMWLTEGKKHEARRPLQPFGPPTTASTASTCQPLAPVLSQVRKVWQHFGFAVTRLMRQAYGPFELAALHQGEVEEVPSHKVQALLRGVLPRASQLPPSLASWRSDPP